MSYRKDVPLKLSKDVKQGYASELNLGSKAGSRTKPLKKSRCGNPAKERNHPLFEQIEDAKRSNRDGIKLTKILAVPFPPSFSP
jgi:hypothetical protein